MRILSVITSFTTGGAEMLVSNLSAEFADQGHSASVAALVDAASVGNASDAETKMTEKLQHASVEAPSLALTNRRNIFAGIAAMRRLIKLFEPDVIHVHTTQAALILAFLRPKLPIVMTHHNSRFNFPPSLFLVLNTVVDHYVAISDKCKANIEQHTRKPITKIINAAGRNFAAGSARTSVNSSPQILSVGTLSAQKDYPTLIRAAVRLRDRLSVHGRSPTINIAGSGEPMTMLQDLIDKIAVEDVVSLLGQRSDIDQLMLQSDLYVNSSLYEGMPVALIEALQSGLPIVATDVEGNREVVYPNENGLLVPAQDPDKLADAMAEALLDSNLHAKLSQGAIVSSGNFSLVRAAQSHLALYEQLCNQNADK